ncbi:glycoside hydrolase superfamily [Dichotomocladium elegans]|nr:glycoside hydrolase superfamily [Dichotomocladium elegans]
MPLGVIAAAKAGIDMVIVIGGFRSFCIIQSYDSEGLRSVPENSKSIAEDAALRCTCIDFSYRYRGGPKHCVKFKDVELRPDQPFENGDIKVTTAISQMSEGQTGSLVSITVEAFKPLELCHFETKYAASLEGYRMLANGFQSWSQATELGQEDRILPIQSMVATMTQYNLQGDYDFFEHKGEKGLIHSSAYTHFSRDGFYYFAGSLTEDLGYTYFKADFCRSCLGIYKDVVGKHLDCHQPLELVRIFFSQGDALGPLWDEYSRLFSKEDRRVRKQDIHVSGWTSWYNYYGDVSENVVLKNLEALVKHKYPIQVFQIDDGFQTAVGDWLTINEKFPRKLKPIVDQITEAGYTAGLWLAPFAVGFTSQLAKDHPDWLVLDEHGKPVVAGPNWGGFYALDMYHFEARAYLKKVFDTVLREWGFGLVKLDFLFAAAMIPRMGKSRGEIMWDAMTLVRDLVGPDKLILGCGVPLACAWRCVDYCRVGSDVAPWWEDAKLKYLHVRERVSTANSLTSTLHRWPMSDRMFGNDPDVIILRGHKNRLNPEERYTLSVLNNVLGALVFTSDNVSEYGKDEHLLYRATFPKVVASVSAVTEIAPAVYEVCFSFGGREYSVFANLSRLDKTVTLPTKPQLLFATDNEMHMTRRPSSFLNLLRQRHAPLFCAPGTKIVLKSHETKTFVHLFPAIQDSQGVAFLGSTSHIVPGAEIAHLRLSPDNTACAHVELMFHKDNARKHQVYLGIGPYLFANKSAVPHHPACKVNGVAPKFETFKVSGSTQHVLVAVVTEDAK